MARIQSSVGLITGIPIQETVDQLMSQQAIPRDRLVARQKILQTQQTAISDLMALTLGVQLAVRRLKSSDLFSTRQVASSNAALLTGTATSDAVPGQYPFVPARMAQSHHALSTGLAARDQALGGGTFSFRFGGHVNQGAALADLNGGLGVASGKIRIISRSGTAATIDLRYARTIDDVLQAINTTDDLDVVAFADGDRIRLVDQSGGTGNLKVLEVSGGTTAADLGLADIDVAADEATGADLARLFPGISLNQLRDGSGISLRAELADLAVTLSDGSNLEIDLNPADATEPRTLGDLLERINAADPGRLEARIAADGKRIELVDLTGGGGTFSVTSPLGSTVAEELGLTGPASGGVITGSRLIAGLKTTLLASLNGGQGLGSLGAISLTDRSGQNASVDLSAAETLDDVIGAINAAGIGIRVSYNSARNGLALTDITGATAGNLIVADADATGTATKLGLAANVAETSINSGTLDRQVVSRNTLLSSLFGDRGVSQGTILVTDSTGKTASVNLSLLGAETVGDAIDAFNGLSLGIRAQINDAGDGLVLIDTAGGSGTLTVADFGTGKAAADLGIAGTASDLTVGGQSVKGINGSTTFSVTLEADDTLDDLVSKINALGAGATASVLSDGSGSLPHHLSLLSGQVGKAGELVIDGSGLGLAFRDLTSAQDALLQIGGSTSVGTLVSSPTNTFKDVLPGLSVTLGGQSTETVTLSVTQTVEDAATAIQLFVDQYNKVREKLDSYTAYDPATNVKGTLFASREALRLDTELSQAITGRYFNDGTVRSLAELGVSISETGKLSFDKTRLEARYAADPEGISQFFADEETGFAVKVDELLETIVGVDRSLLLGRVETLQRQIDDVGGRITSWNARLDRSRERLLLQFFRLEESVARIQSSLTAIGQIQAIPPLRAGSDD